MADYKLYQGDCLDIMPKLEKGSIQAVIADIPYGVVNREGGIRILDKGNADIETFSLASVMKQVSRLSDCFHIFCGTEQISELRTLGIEMGYSTRLFIWEKTNPSPMNGQYMWLSGLECAVFGRRKGAIFNQFCANPIYKGGAGTSELHPTQKPVALMEYLVKTYTNEGDTVLDFTMGSGTTGVACMRTKRKFVGVELDPDYFRIAEQRIKNAAGDFVSTDEEIAKGQRMLPL